MGVSDRLWGQAIVAIYSPTEAKIEAASIKAALQNCLSRFKHPKRWIAVESLPRNAEGKINRASLRAWVVDHYPALADSLPHTETASE